MSTLAWIPALAGFVLSIAIAADADARIGERRRTNAPVRGATSMAAIVDSLALITFLLAAFWLAGGSAAPTLAAALLIGIATTMTAGLVVRSIRSTRPGRVAAAPTRFDFIDMRQFAFAVSAALILPGALLLATVGLPYDAELGADSTVRRNLVVATLGSTALILIYLGARLDWRIALASIFATVHDLLAMLAVIIYLDMAMSFTMAAVMLAILGLSLHDKNMLFDHVHRALRARPNRSVVDVLNTSVNQTLRRSVLTTGISLALVLLFTIDASSRPYALVLAFGIVVSKLSTIFVAAPALRRLRDGAYREAATRSIAR